MLFHLITQLSSISEITHLSGILSKSHAEDLQLNSVLAGRPEA